MKKMTFILVFSLCMVLLLSAIALAYEDNPSAVRDGKLVAYISITDPETGEVWESEIDAKDIYFSTSAPSNNMPGVNNVNGFSSDSEEMAFVSFSLSDYLEEADSISATKTDDVTMTAGMTYKVSGDNVEVIDVFGSTVNEGYYYVLYRDFYWRHPGTGGGGHYEPEENTWEYTVNSGYGLYTDDTPPRTILDCRVGISGMTAYRDVSVTCTLVP